MRRVGKVWSLEVSARYLLLFGLFLLVFVAGAVLVINRSWDLYIDNQELRQRVSRLSRRVEEYQFKSQVVNHYHQLVSELNQAEENQTAAPVSETPPAPVAPAAPTEPVPPLPSPPEKPPVDTENLSLQTVGSGSGLRFKFFLRNVHPENKPVSGYTMVVFENHKTEPPTLVPYPSMDLARGRPANYKRGHQFYIRHGKTVRGQISKLTRAGDFTLMRVLVYSEDGKILLDKPIVINEEKTE